MNIQHQPQASRVGPQFERIRHEARVRTLRVEERLQLTPSMLRIIFTGRDLEDFRSPGFDDHVRLLIPVESGLVERRDYTPRQFDDVTQRLTIDFFLHGAGPATSWALDAKPGSVIQIGGPRGSAVAPSTVRRWLLIGDETALPAISRRIEEAKTKMQVTSVIAVSGVEDQQNFKTDADITTFWTYRSETRPAKVEAILEVIHNIGLQDDTFVWVAAEAAVARRIRDYIVDQRHHPRSWVKAAGYWIKGHANAHERLE